MIKKTGALSQKTYTTSKQAQAIVVSLAGSISLRTSMPVIATFLKFLPSCADFGYLQGLKGKGWISGRENPKTQRSRF
jgi:hypothetical protein